MPKTSSVTNINQSPEFSRMNNSVIESDNDAKTSYLDQPYNDNDSLP